MQAHEGDFHPFFSNEFPGEDYFEYIGASRLDGEWGGQLEVTAFARIYQVNVVIH